MEPTMINLKVLSTVAAIALVLPIAAPSASFAQHFKGGRGGVAVGGGGGAPAARFSGGAPAARFGAGAAPVAHYNGPGASSMARYSGVTTRSAPAARWSGATTGTRFSTGPSVTRYSGGYGGGWNGGYRHRRGGGFIPGAVAGAVIGGALASSYPYYGYGGSDYYDYGYNDDPYSYGDAAVVAAVPDAVGGDDAVAYCMQTYQSYDPASGTYLGYDGLRHPCP
jgi:BA14K-like protein